jgi:4-hydroxy-4-methyl-2-oxoglutarate aldolase
MAFRELPAPLLGELKQLDSCNIANAIERFDVRLRNRGFTGSGIECMFPEMPPVAGYAATLRVRTAEPPMEGHSYYYRLDWLEHVASIPRPTILVIQDLDNPPGLGSFVGDVHANILQALGCVGLVTNGAVRNLPEVRALGFQMHAGGVSASHAFAHLVDYGKPVEIRHMEVHPGDLIFGDLHGSLTIPLGIAERVPAVAREMQAQERAIVQLCHAPDFSIARLRAEVSSLEQKRKVISR